MCLRLISLTVGASAGLMRTREPSSTKRTTCAVHFIRRHPFRTRVERLRHIRR